MDSKLDEESLKRAYEGAPQIEGAIKAAAAAGPQYIELFNYISLHINNIKNSAYPSNGEPASKKRRIDEPSVLASRPATNGTNGHVAASADDEVLLEIKDISMLIPHRKKFTMCFTKDHLYARLPDSKEPVAGTSFAWKNIEYAFLLPIPEKTQKQYNILLFPNSSALSPLKPQPGVPPPPEPLVFTFTDTAPKAGAISGSLSSDAAAVADEYKSLLLWALNGRFKEAGNMKLKIVQSDPKLFASEQRQAHRPNEKATWVKAFRGSKDGFLFFLPTGILWGFKKPLLFLPFDRISGLSYTSVLQRTFNLSIEADITGTEDGREEIEFSMLDQEDFGGIDGFVKRHGLQDQSLAEKRRAKRENVNVVRDEDGNVVGNVEAGELQRAEAEANGGEEGLDDEESEGEDYDPGSGGESEGSGSSSEEEDAEGDAGGDDADGDEDEDEDEDE